MTSLQSRSSLVFSPVLSRYTSLEIERGEGSFIFSKTGEKYLDLASGIAVTATGHCHPEVVKAITHQASRFIHPCLGLGYYEAPVQLAEKLQSCIGKEYAVFFNQSGSEAVETSMKLARYVTEKPTFIAFEGGFHGRTLGALSLTTSKQKYRERYAPFLESVRFFPYPYTSRCPWGQDESDNSCDAAIDALHHSDIWDDSVAAVIIEPILGEGGYIPAPEKFLKALASLCKQKNILLIFDEIQSGIGRTGSWFYCQQLGIEPDIIVSAKGLASGMPLSACIAKKNIMDQWKPGAHGGTYGGNPVSCAAALATLNVIEPYLPDVIKKGKIAEQFLREKLSDNPIVGDIRVRGLMIGIELVSNKAQKTPHPTVIKSIIEGGLAKGIIVISCGIHDNVIRIAPSLLIEEDVFLNGLECLVSVINACALR